MAYVYGLRDAGSIRKSNIFSSFQQQTILEATKTFPILKQQQQTIKRAKHTSCFIFLQLAHHIIVVI